MSQSLNLVISDLAAIEEIEEIELTVEAAAITGGTYGEDSESYGKEPSRYGKHPVIVRPKCPPYKPPVIQCITAPCP